MSMIKRYTLVHATSDPTDGGFADRWRAATLREIEATPPDARPTRVAHVVSRFGRVEPTFHGASIEWFAHADTIEANDAFLDTSDLDNAVIIDDRFVVEERCVFGQDWFDDRWNAPAGTRSFILVGLLEKADFLTRTQFRDYWWDQHRPLANEMLPPETQPPAYFHNYVIPGQGTRWDGLGEFFDPGIERVKARTQWTQSPEAAPIIEDEKRFLNRETRQVIIGEFEVIVR
ncbi:MAG: EthD domain-containing protein [Acidimicrobiia bacterium]